MAADHEVWSAAPVTSGGGQLSGTQVLGRVLPHAETCDKRRSGPACLPRASEPLPGMPRKKGQWLEVSAEESEVL